MKSIASTTRKLAAPSNSAAKTSKVDLTGKSQEEILKLLAAGKITLDEAMGASKEIEKVNAEKGLYCKVSQKGAISVYGLQRMPVTLYVEQWDRLLAFGGDITAFAEAHNSELSRKADKGKS